MPGKRNAIQVSARYDWRITGAGHKKLDGCLTDFETSCRRAFPQSAWAWCAGCRA